MIFIIGGSYQGKRAYAQEKFSLTPEDMFVCTEETTEIDFGKRIISNIDRFALGCVRCGQEPKEYWQSHLDAIGDSILIADDISCGVVPLDPIVRTWREATGRANNYLAGEAEQVIRVFCGLGQVIK